MGSSPRCCCLDVNIQAFLKSLILYLSFLSCLIGVEGIEVQEMIKDGIEVIIGLFNDPNFGMTIMFGLGGVFTELLKDVSFRVLPINSRDAKTMLTEIKGNAEVVLQNIWAIGGERGWYYGNWLWSLRGFMDKLLGGVGLRRGRTNLLTINTGDTLDFWRVLAADKQGKRLLLYAEMKLPGEAWLEFKIIERAEKKYLKQVATFRPKGLLGRLYWYMVLPMHFFVFDGMSKNLIKYNNKP